MSSFIIDSFKGGISDYEDKGLSGSFKFGKNLDIRRKRDSLKAGQALADDLATGGVMTAGVVQVVNSSDGNSYWGLSNGRILKRTSVGVWSLVYTDASGILRGIGEWVNDNDETGIYWATDTDLRRKPMPGLADWTDVDTSAGNPAQTYPKTNLTDTPNHFMKVVNGVFLINNGNTLAFVGYDESYTNNALQLIPGNEAQVILDNGLTAVIGANRDDDSSQSWVYLWDQIAQNYNDRQALPLADINNIIKTEHTFLQIGSDGALYFLGSVDKLPVITFPEGGQVSNSGSDTDSGLAMFGVYGNGTGYSGVYGFGRRRKNAPFALNLEYQLDCDIIHAVQKVGTELLVAYETSGVFGVKKVDSTTKASQAVYESLILKMPPDLNKKPVIDIVQLSCLPLPANCSVEVWRRIDQVETGGTDYLGDTTGNDDGWFQCSLVDGTGALSTENSTEGAFKVGDDARFLEIKVVLNCDANNSPEVLKIQPFFNNER